MKKISLFNDCPCWDNQEDYHSDFPLDDEDEDYDLEPPDSEPFDDDYWASIPDHWEGEKI